MDRQSPEIIHSHEASGKAPCDSDLEKIAGLKNPAALERQPTDNAGQVTQIFGCDQNWFQDTFQQKAGCGPCAATNLLHYASFPDTSMAEFVQLMHQVWHYVTPGIMGVHTARHLAKGIERFASDNMISIATSRLEIPFFQSKRPSPETIIQFIREGLEKDSPVAFLNRSNGGLTDLENWHWVTITDLYRDKKDGSFLADIANYGTLSRINLTTWICKTRLGGGFVYCRVKGLAEPA